MIRSTPMLLLLFLISCNTEVETSRQVLEAHLNQTGGLDNWRKLNKIEVKSDVVTEIGGNQVSQVTEIKKIQLPGSQRTENYIGDSLIQMIITNEEEGSTFYNIQDDKPSGATDMEMEKVWIKHELNLLDHADQLIFVDTIWKEQPVYVLSDSVTQIEYIFHRDNFHLLAKIEESPYGTSLTEFGDYRTVDALRVPFSISTNVPKSSYSTKRTIDRVNLNPVFEEDVFQHDKSWQIIVPGKKLPEFQVNLYPGDGKITNAGISDKVVLIDFWATWCKPCIAEFPNLRKLYEAYKPAGFEILSVSLDQNQKALDNFLEDEELPWLNAYEPQAFDSELAANFQLAAIPKPILVDSKGVILAVDTDATGEKLAEKLKELF